MPTFALNPSESITANYLIIKRTIVPHFPAAGKFTPMLRHAILYGYVEQP
jgi:hypothetical protein